VSDIIVIQPDENNVVVSEITNSITTASDGPQGPAGPTGATGATGATGPAGSSGVVAVTAPITNSGTSSSANIGISAGTTSSAGALQLTDSVASTSTTTAATPNAVKTAYDLADTKLLKYATSWQTKYRSTYWYEAKVGATINTSIYTQNRAYYWSLFLSEAITIDRLGVEVTGANASTTWRIGIYNSDSNGLPSTVLLDAGTVDCSTTGLKTITVSQTIQAGFYFIAGCWQGGSSSPFLRSLLQTGGIYSPIASTNQQSTNYITQYHVDSVTGAFPTFSGSSTGSSPFTRTQFRIA
jgi:hypothetical protein